MYYIDAACWCHQGKVRSNNEDNFLFDDYFLERDNSGLQEPVQKIFPLKDFVCFAVFDGMGGQSMGEDAAYIAAETLNEMTWKNKKINETISDYCKNANENIFALSDHYRIGMPGTTVVMLCFTNEQVWVCNIGDSRAYLIRNEKIKQISVDHVENSEFRFYRRKGKAGLTQNLGIDPEELQISPHIDMYEIQRGDIYLLCSDGLTDSISEQEIYETIVKEEAIQIATRKLVELALIRGGKDNITALLCKVI